MFHVKHRMKGKIIESNVPRGTLKKLTAKNVSRGTYKIICK